jgi:hypothetical protein
MIAVMPTEVLALALDNVIRPALANDLTVFLNSQARAGISLRARFAFFADFYFSQESFL